MEDYTISTSLPASVERAFQYHEQPGALQRLIPPWESVEIEHSDGSLEIGSRVVLKLKVAGIPLRWVAEHTHYDPPDLFADRQVSGPFAAWEHRHRFEPVGLNCQLMDEVRYELPLGKLGQLFGSRSARTTVKAMFAYRHRVTRDDLTLQGECPSRPLKVAISGSSGMVGQQLRVLLGLFGHEVFSLVRRTTSRPNEIAPWESEAEAEKLSGFDAVIHLAGKPIAGKRWTEDVKQQIRDSRVELTSQLCQRLAGLPEPPQTLICASASGYYGDRGETTLDEESSPGGDFLAQVARDWESACRSASDAGIRVVNARFGMILSPTGGALQQMLLPAKLLGGSLGSGHQWWSWIALDDVLGAIYHTLTDESISGPVNFVAPTPIRNRDFAKTLGNVLGRPALVPAPAFALRAAVGEMADALLLASFRVIPRKLKTAGYRYRFTELDEFLRYALGKQQRWLDDSSTAIGA